MVQYTQPPPAAREARPACKLQKVFTTMRTIEPIREELLSQAKCLLYDGPVIDYGDADQTIVEGVREVGPTTGLALSAILNE